MADEAFRAQLAAQRPLLKSFAMGLWRAWQAREDSEDEEVDWEEEERACEMRRVRPGGTLEVQTEGSEREDEEEREEEGEKENGGAYRSFQEHGCRFLERGAGYCRFGEHNRAVDAWEKAALRWVGTTYIVRASTP